MGHGLLRPAAVALAVIVATAALGACGGQASPTSDSDQGQSLSASRTKEYRTLAELAKESSIVAVVRATDDAAVEILHDIPFTVTTVKVTRALQGTSAGAVLKVRQTGSAKTEIQHDFPPILEAGQPYLLFLYPFTLTKGVSTDQYYVTGDAGIFAADGARFRRLDPVSTALPGVVTESDAITALNG